MKRVIIEKMKIAAKTGAKLAHCLAKALAAAAWLPGIVIAVAHAAASRAARSRRARKAFASVNLLAVFLTLFSWLAFLPSPFNEPKKAEAATTYQFVPVGGELVIGTETAITSATAAAAADGTNVGSWKGTAADDGYHWKVSSISGSFPNSGINMQLIVGGVALNGANTMAIQTEVDQDSALGSIYIQVCDWVSSASVDSAADAQCTNGGWMTLNNRKQGISAATAASYHWNIYDGYWADTNGQPVSTPLSNFVNGSNQVRVRYFTTSSNVVTTAVDFLRISAFVSPIYAPAGLESYTGRSGIVTSTDDSGYITDISANGTYMYAYGHDESNYWRIEKRRLDTGALDTGFGANGSTTSSSETQSTDSAWTISTDSSYMYLVGRDTSYRLRIEKRLLSDGSLVSGFGTNGVLTGAVLSSTANPGAATIDSTYVYIAAGGADDNYRIEKRLLSDGSLVNGFGTNGVVTGPAQSYGATAIEIDSTYMYVAGEDDNGDLYIEKRLLSDGSLVSGFGTNGALSSDSNSSEATAIKIDSTYLYVLAADAAADWRVEKRLLSDGSLVSGFGSAGVAKGALKYTYGAPRGLVIDGSYAYVATSYGTWYVHKRRLDTGAAVEGFGDDGIFNDNTNVNAIGALAMHNGSVIAAGDSGNYNWRYSKVKADAGLYDLSFGDNSEASVVSAGYYYVNTNVVTQGASDNAYAQFTAQAGAQNPAIAYFPFKNVKTYEGMNTAMVRAESSCATTVLSRYRYVIYNFADGEWEYLSGYMDCSTTDYTNEFTKAAADIDDYVQNGEMRVGVLHDGSNSVRIDQIYAILGSTNADANACQATFGTATGGRVASNPTAPGSDQATALAVDGGYMYVGGFSSPYANTNWMLQKRSATTGDLDPAFAAGGILKISSGNFTDQITTIKADGDYLYIGGYQSITSTNQNWRIEKRYKSTGALVTDFGASGVIASVPSANNDKIVSMAIDGGYLYILGEERSGGTGNAEWRIEKRNMSDGALVSGFGASGVVSYNATAGSYSSVPGAIRVDGGYLYVAGGMISGTTNIWWVEKRELSTGGLVSGFGTGGAMMEDVTNNGEVITDMETDGTYMYLFGTDFASGTYTQWRFEKRLLSDGSLVNGFGSSGVAQYDPTSADNDIASDMAIDGTYLYAAGARDDDTGTWHIEKRFLSDGSLVAAFDAEGIAESEDGAHDVAMAVQTDGTNIYVAGYGAAPGDNQWLVEKRDASTGLRVSTGFAPTTCAGTRNMDTTSGDRDGWAIQTEDETNDHSHDFFARDNDGDGVAEEASSATIDFNVTVPNGATVVSNFFASRHVSGAAGTVQVALKDYSGATGAIGGRALVGAVATNAMVYTDPIVTGGVGSGGYLGYMTNPEDNVDTLNNKMSLSLVTTIDGGIVNNSTSVWDFAMVSIGWVEEASSTRPPANYQFVPTGGELLSGYQASTTAATASAAADGTNVGSWKGTLADDGYHWKFGGAFSRANITIGGVLLNGANTLTLQTELDQSATPAASVFVMICDWVSSVGASAATAGDGCDGTGGWRTLNNRQVGLTTGTATTYHWNLYDGYWSDGTNTIPTPLTNFVNESNQVLIQFGNISSNNATVAIDFARASAVINPVYAPAGATAAAGYGVVTGTLRSYGMDEMAADSTYLYAVGYTNVPWNSHIEKRRLDTGALDPSFGSNGTIESRHDFLAQGIAIDSTYMYVVGEGSDDDDVMYGARMEKRRLSDGSLDTGFNGTGGKVPTVNFDTAYDIAIDGTYMYVVGGGWTDTYNGWWIQKMLLSTGATSTDFGTNGVQLSDATSDFAMKIAIDGTYMYVAGFDDADNWRIEKRLLSDGSLVSGFGTNGVVTGDAATNNAFDIKIDGAYMYVSGSNASGDGRIEKRLLSDGSLVNGFGTNGVIDGVAATNNYGYIHIAGGYLYVAEMNSTNDWRIEKRDLTSGSLVSGFGVSGVVTGEAATDWAGPMVSDGTNLYIGGDDATNDWRIEKRLLSDGSYVNGFGMLAMSDYANTNVITQGASDGNFFTVTGTSTIAADAYFTFKNVKTYPGMNTVMVRSEASCSAATVGMSYAYKIYNFSSSAWEDISNPVECHTTDIVNVFATTTADITDYISSGEIRIGMYSNIPHATTKLQVDQIYMMLGTTSTDANSCQVTFGSETGGRYAINPSSLSDQVAAIAVDSTYVYLAGYDMKGGDAEWRIEKRNRATGALDENFGTGGVVLSDPTANNDQATAIVVDGSDIYIGGYESVTSSNQNWRLEKRDKATGALVTAFDNDGIYTIALSSNNDKINAIAVDSTHVYAIGEQRGAGSANAAWYILKHAKDTGQATANYSSNFTSGNDMPYAAKIDGSYLYVAGSEATGTSAWRIQKHATSDLTVDAGFGSSGAVTYNPSTGADEAFALDTDGTYMYVAGYDSATTNTQWRIEKRLLSTGATTTDFGGEGLVQTNPSAYQDRIFGIDVAGSYVFVAGEDRTESTNYSRWRIEKRAVSDASLDASFNSDGIVTAQDGLDDQARALVVDGSDVFVGGYGTAPGDNQWLVEKYSASTGLRDSTSMVGGCAGTRTMDTTASERTAWAIQSENESTTFGHTYIARDNDGDATVEEAASATLEFDVDVPADAMVTSIFFASRHNGGNATVQFAQKDYSGLSGAIGGRTLVGTTAATSMTYTDNIVLGGVTSGGFMGLHLNPEDYIDTVNGKMSASLVTTASAPTTDDSVATWDFAMVTYAWIEPSRGVTISGTLYGADESTPLGTSPDIKLAVDGTTQYSATAEANGTFEIQLNSIPASGSLITLWTDGGADRASFSLVYGNGCNGSPSCTNLTLAKDKVILYGRDGTTVTNAKLAACDNDSGTGCSDTDIGFTANAGALALSGTDTTLKVSTGTTYVPEGAVTAHDLDVAGTMNLDTNDPAVTIGDDLKIGGALTASASSTLTFGGDWTNDGTFTHSSGTVAYAAGSDGQGTIAGSSGNTFYNFSGTGANSTLRFKSAATTTFEGTLSLQGDGSGYLSVSSDQAGTQWLLLMNGSGTASFVILTDGGCAVGTKSPGFGYNVQNAGNNGSCWTFRVLTLGGGSWTAPIEGGDGGGTPTGGGTSTSTPPVEGGDGGGTPVGGGGAGGGGGGAAP